MQFWKTDFTKDENKFFWLVLVFGIYFIVACYKLTNAPLWADESTEFYYSSILFGPTRDFPASSNMYQRIISTFQPPLYNIVMFFWLKISESEWWFRFAGVVAGFFGAVGLYKTIGLFTNYKIALSSVLLYTFNLRLIYYIQECAEYNLMLALLFWAVYFYCFALKETNLRNIILFVIFSILPIYSQYGSAFAVLPLLGSFFILLFLRKDKKGLLQSLIVYASAFFFAALPLYYFFLRPQRLNQTGGAIRPLSEYHFMDGSLLIDTLHHFFNMFQWNMTALYPDKLYTSSSTIALKILLILLFFITVHWFFVSKNTILKSMVVCNVVTWFLYYFAVIFNLYAGGFTPFRYNLFLIPTWLITIIVVLFEYYGYLSTHKSSRTKTLSIVYRSVICMTAICYCLNGWTEIKKNWVKQNPRGIVDQWYKSEAYKGNTFVYYGGAAGFCYYLEHDKRFQEEYLDNVFVQFTNGSNKAIRARTKEEHAAAFLEYYNGVLPDDLYIPATHIMTNDLDLMLETFKDQGYQLDKIFNNGGVLWHIYK